MSRHLVDEAVQLRVYTHVALTYCEYTQNPGEHGATKAIAITHVDVVPGFLDLSYVYLCMPDNHVCNAWGTQVPDLNGQCTRPEAKKVDASGMT